MSEVSEFLGKIAGTAVTRLLTQGHTGIRLQDVTTFAPEPFLHALSDVGPVRVIFAGSSAADVRALCRRAKFPESRATADLSKGTDWRNDPNVSDPLILIAFTEEERLGSFHRFVSVLDQHLYRLVCELGTQNLSPNQVLLDWWSNVLGRVDMVRQIPVHRLAAYYLALEAQSQRLPEASRECLHHLGLLPSREFFERASPAQIVSNVRANRLMTMRIELLSKADRDRLHRSLETVGDADRPEFQQTLAAILAYSRTGADEERGRLVLEDVRRIFESRKESKPRSKKPVHAEAAAVSAVLNDDTEEVQAIAERLREKIENIHEEESPRVVLDVPTRTEQVILTIPQPLVALVKQAVTEEHLGGIYRIENDDDLQSIVGSLEQASFEPALLTGDKSFDATLRRVIETKDLEPEVLATWERCTAARKRLAADAAAIAVAPLVILTSDDALLAAGHDYLEAYQDLLACLRDRFERIAKRSPKGSRRFCATLLLHDTILFATKSGVKGILSPLHPLHLWKFVRLAEQIRRERDTLTPEFKELLAEQTEHLPHFVTAVFVPEGFVSERPLVLPETGHLGTLPCYEEDHPNFAGDEGQDRILRILQKFLVLYPHARGNLRLCLIDPPSLPDLLDELARAIVGGDLNVEAMEVRVRFTQRRPMELGLDDQQLEAISDVFAEEHRQLFHLVLNQEITTYQDILSSLDDSPAHVVAVFDPSRSHVGQFSGQSTGFIHPLVLPKEFQYDPLEDQLTIIPAATGDIFDLYYHLQNRLNNALTGSLYGVSTTLGHHFPPPHEFLRRCTWLVIGDRLLDTHPLDGGHIISFEPGVRRDIIVLTENFTKFEREFDYHLRRGKLNLDPTEEAIRELIVASADLVGEGLLGLVRSSGD